MAGVKFVYVGSILDLENYFDLAIKITKKYGGDFDKFMGDGVMAIFGRDQVPILGIIFLNKDCRLTR